MIEPAFVETLARYNAWQNRNLVTAADTLSDEARRLDRGAFFRSIHETFNHVLWADETWLHRLAGAAKPAIGGRESPNYVADWSTFRERRALCDTALHDWAQSVSADWLAGTVTWYSGAVDRELAKPRGFVVAHLFNHQTHHRGQIHAMLTAAGARTEDTDLMLVDEPR